MDMKDLPEREELKLNSCLERTVELYLLNLTAKKSTIEEFKDICALLPDYIAVSKEETQCLVQYLNDLQDIDINVLHEVLSH